MSRPRPSRRFFTGLAVSLGLFTLAAGCGKGAAEQALAAASVALEQAKPEIERYVPGDLKALTDDLSKARAAFDKGDYKGALSTGQAALPRIQAALQAAEKKKGELLAAFTELKASLPARMESLKGRLAQLAAAQSLPSGLDQATVETAQANLESVAKVWSDTLSKFDAGDVVTAVGQANDVKTKVEEMARAFLPAAPAKK